MKAQKITARTFGIFFLLAFLSYGMGSGITASITGAADSLSTIQSNSSQLILGVILMALVHTIVNIGLPVLMVPILKPFNKTLTYGYLSAGITATVIIIVGSIFLMLYLPLGSMYQSAETTDLQHFETIGTLFTKGNFIAYQIGMTIWGFGGLMLCYTLYISKLVPKLFAIWGFVGYLVFIAGTISELFGYTIGVMLAIPGGLFEISLSIYLIIKGFRKPEQTKANRYPLQYAS